MVCSPSLKGSDLQKLHVKSFALVCRLALRRSLAHWRSLHQRDQRFPFFDDVRGELRRVVAADVLRRVDRSSRDEQDVTGLETHRRLALDLILQRAFEHVDDLFARMRMPRGDISRVEIDAHLANLASGPAEAEPLQPGSFVSGST